MKDALIKWLGGYTKSDISKVGCRQFNSYEDMRRLGGFLPTGTEVDLIGEGVGGKFAIRQYEGADNGGTLIDLDVNKAKQP